MLCFLTLTMVTRNENFHLLYIKTFITAQGYALNLLLHLATLLKDVIHSLQ